MTQHILAIDTTAELCSAAIASGNKVYARTLIAPKLQAQKMLSLIEGLLTETGLAVNQLDAIAFGAGPGSFTGLRVACGIAQGLAFGADLPVIPISSLRTIAWMVHQQNQADHVMAALDARQHQIYWGLYKYDPKLLMKLQGDEVVVSPGLAPLPKKIETWVGAGSGWKAYRDELIQHTGDQQFAVHEELLPEAEALVELACNDFNHKAGLPAHMAKPEYVRNKVVD
jgi:tRNA threonylcarbamoyladenosine biosynthesis protein TsaB